jgi:hypothetical protein
MTIVKFVRSHKLQNNLMYGHMGFKLCTLMPEDGRGGPRHVACNVIFNMCVVCDSSVQIATTNLSQHNAIISIKYSEYSVLSVSSETATCSA